MDGSETHSRGDDSFITAASASHPPVQCKYPQSFPRSLLRAAYFWACALHCAFKCILFKLNRFLRGFK